MIKKNRLFKASLMAILLFVNGISNAQTYAPGTDVLGYGYNVFGEYAKMESRKDYCLFTFRDEVPTMIGSQQYQVPKFVSLKNMSDHSVKTVSGESKREYAQSLSAQVGLNFGGLFFSGSINASYAFNMSGNQQYFYFTYMDANTKWYISLDTRNIETLHGILDPQFKKDLEELPADELFETYGTHYIASAYLGGRIDYTSTSVITEKSSSEAISVAVTADYKAVSAKSQVDESSKETLRDAETKTDLRVIGGNSEMINGIGDLGQYADWASGIVTMPVLCDFDGKSLRPIWEFASAERKRELEAAFMQLVAANPLPEAIASTSLMQNKTFHIKSVSEGTYWDLPKVHFNADKLNGRIGLYQKDINKGGLQGADRFFKLIPHSTKPEYVFLQPQHTDLVASIAHDATTPGAELILYNKGENNESQMFKLIEVDGKKKTYYLECAKSGLYLTVINGKVTAEPKKRKAENQEWVFEKANTSLMMPPFLEKYLLKNVAGNLYSDIPGSAPNIEKNNGTHVNVYRKDDGSDRTIQLNRVANQEKYFYIQPLHDTKVFEISDRSKNDGAGLVIWDQHGAASQQFEFVYAGYPMTYFIKNVNSGKFLEVDRSLTSVNGTWIKQSSGSGDTQKNKMWKLEPTGNHWFIPNPNQEFFIRCAYSNKYWDIPGAVHETNYNGKYVILWDNDEAADRRFKFKGTGDGSWLLIEVQNGGKLVTVHDNNHVNDWHLQIHENRNNESQKFAIKPIAPYEFVLFTTHWKAVTIRSDKFYDNGAAVILWDQHYHASQRFVLEYATGHKKGQALKLF